ncbi:hypothetical protein QJS10_CPB15g01311 [Acorus calamus]|uniref:chorismate mutase n=1 Tax=Acorus calamus TaxID=4465 RepID=A0AAV9D6B2_ACOCL|nr:hypothetical protein QJS10_CPB15g01311 [Acorus calamus]
MEVKVLKTSPSICNPQLFRSPRPSSLFSLQTKKNPSFRLLAASTGHGVRPTHSSDASPPPPPPPLRSSKKRVDESEILTLDSIRQSLIRQEDSIIYSLLERSQYCYNADTYNRNVFYMDGFHGSLVEFMVRETERLHAQVGRYKSPDEHPFFAEDLPEPMLPPLQYPQALSKRIHYGKFVAEAKFRASPEAYEAAIRAQDRDHLMRLLTYETVEAAIVERVEMKARTFGQELNGNGDQDGSPIYKIKPSLVADLYGDWIMPLTKQVQVEYLLRRLD